MVNVLLIVIIIVSIFACICTTMFTCYTCRTIPEDRQELLNSEDIITYDNNVIIVVNNE